MEKFSLDDLLDLDLEPGGDDEENTTELLGRSKYGEPGAARPDGCEVVGAVSRDPELDDWVDSGPNPSPQGRHQGLDRVSPSGVPADNQVDFHQRGDRQGDYAGKRHDEVRDRYAQLVSDGFEDEISGETPRNYLPNLPASSRHSDLDVGPRGARTQNLAERDSEVSGGEPSTPLTQGAVNVSSLLNRGFELCAEQAQMGVNPEMQDVESLMVSNLKGDTFLNSITNAMTVEHLAHIAEAGDTKFQRREEMKVYNPLLYAFGRASGVVSEKVDYFARQMERTMGRLIDYESEGIYLDHLGSVHPNDVANIVEWEDPNGGGRFEGSKGKPKSVTAFGDKPKGGTAWYKQDVIGDAVALPKPSKGMSERSYVTDQGEVKEFKPGTSPAELLMHLDGLQYIFDKSLSNMAHLTNGIDSLVKSERHSGARPWGNSRNGIPAVAQPWGIPRRGVGEGRDEMRALLNGGDVGGENAESVKAGALQGNVSGSGVREMTQEEVFRILEMQKAENEKNGVR